MFSQLTIAHADWIFGELLKGIEDDTWALLKYENISLALVLPNSHPPHIAFEKDDAHKYGELKLHRDGTSSVYVRDPSNNAVEMLKLNK